MKSITQKGNRQQIKAEIKRCQQSEAIQLLWGAAEPQTILDGKQRSSI